MANMYPSKKTQQEIVVRVHPAYGDANFPYANGVNYWNFYKSTYNIPKNYVIKTATLYIWENKTRTTGKLYGQYYESEVRPNYCTGFGNNYNGLLNNSNSYPPNSGALFGVKEFDTYSSVALYEGTASSGLTGRACDLIVTFGPSS